MEITVFLYEVQLHQGWKIAKFNKGMVKILIYNISSIGCKLLESEIMLLPWIIIPPV